MVVVQLLYESIAIIEGILGHFVQGTVGTAIEVPLIISTQAGCAHGALYEVTQNPFDYGD